MRRSLAEAPEPAGRVAQAQTGEPKQLAPGRGPHTYLDAAVLDELAIVVVQRDADQGHRRRRFVRGVAEHAPPGGKPSKPHRREP
ncbi:hypothetical protein [Streptomyces sp. NBC_00572]|uniref:hypothetical protein n=1 Tax=Streptomyces sp. NBC_00572 TaxID=2903664 RepID=UPI002255A577|nr:hypothetical protein [Streptomyces sp. NBC_00572]MCX4985509.1 hypothetical protein [Streptomyces sp. NBC_00572]